MKSKEIYIHVSLLIQILFFTLQTAFSQGVGINGTGSAPNPSAILDVDASGMNPKGGLLIPRLTTAERNAIVLPAEGLQIFNTVTKCLEIFVYGSWYPIACPGCTPPATPTTVLAPAALTCSSFNANWTVVAGISAYYLDVSTDVGFLNLVPGYSNLSVGLVSPYTVTGLSASTTYWYRIRAATSCSSLNSVVRSPTTSAGTSAVPVATAGTLASCTSIQANWNAAAAATSYYLDVATDNLFSSLVPGFSNLNVGNVLTYSITGLSASTTYYYRVRSFAAGCTSGNSNIITYPTSGGAAQPSPIVGNAAPCAGTSVAYSVTAVGGVTYAWTYSGTGLTCGSCNTNSITANFAAGATSGILTVTPTAACGSGTPQTLAITVTSATPATPGAITGPVSVVALSTGNVYSVPAVPGATSYNWTLPAGATITAGAGTNSITVTMGPVAGATTLTYTTPGAFTTPAGITNCTIEVVGGGGSGGGNGGGGGGGGGYSFRSYTGLSGAAISGTVGAAAGTTSVTLPAISATGGANGTSVANPGIGGGGAGGVGIGGTTNRTGGTGGGGYWTYFGGGGGGAAGSVGNGGNGGNTIAWSGVCITPGGAAGASGGAPGGAGGKGAGFTDASCNISNPAAIGANYGGGGGGGNGNGGAAMTGAGGYCQIVYGSTGSNITVSATNACGTSATSTLPITITPAPANTVIITNSGNWTCPAGVTSATFYLVGGGGGGGCQTCWYNGGGGGGGGATQKTVVTVPLTAYAIVVGAAGVGTVAPGNGGTTTVAAFGLSATGGAGGGVNVGGAGGVGVGGTLNGTGGAGGATGACSSVAGGVGVNGAAGGGSGSDGCGGGTTANGGNGSLPYGGGGTAGICGGGGCFQGLNGTPANYGGGGGGIGAGGPGIKGVVVVVY